MAKAINSNSSVMGMTPSQCRSRVTDAVLASLSLQDNDHLLPQVVETNKVFEAFYHLRTKYPEWLNCLYFEGRAGNYVSRGLEDVLFSLGAFGLVTVENNDYRSLRVNEGIKDEIKKHLEDKSNSEVEILRKMSNEFVELMLK